MVFGERGGSVGRQKTNATRMESESLEIRSQERVGRSRSRRTVRGRVWSVGLAVSPENYLEGV